MILASHQPQGHFGMRKEKRFHAHAQKPNTLFYSTQQYAVFSANRSRKRITEGRKDDDNKDNIEHKHTYVRMNWSWCMNTTTNHLLTSRNFSFFSGKRACIWKTEIMTKERHSVTFKYSNVHKFTCIPNRNHSQACFLHLWHYIKHSSNLLMSFMLHTPLTSLPSFLLERAEGPISWLNVATHNILYEFNEIKTNRSLQPLKRSTKSHKLCSIKHINLRKLPPESCCTSKFGQSWDFLCKAVQCSIKVILYFHNVHLNVCFHSVHWKLFFVFCFCLSYSLFSVFAYVKNK